MRAQDRRHSNCLTSLLCARQVRLVLSNLIIKYQSSGLSAQFLRDLARLRAASRVRQTSAALALISNDLSVLHYHGVRNEVGQVAHGLSVTSVLSVGNLR